MPALATRPIVSPPKASSAWNLRPKTRYDATELDAERILLKDLEDVS